MKRRTQLQGMYFKNIANRLRYKLLDKHVKEWEVTNSKLLA
jgi:hypothetical protein